MRFSTLAGVAALVVASAASPTAHDYIIHEKRDAAPKHWVKRSRLESKAVLPMRIGLTQSNLHRGEDLLMEISDPSSPKFGQHYSHDEVVDIFAPAKEAVDATLAWLHEAGIPPQRIKQSVNKQWLQFEALTEEAERLLKTEYHSWEHVATGRTHVACDQYHIPSHIRHHVDYVTPGLKLLAGGKLHDEDLKAKRSMLPLPQLGKSKTSTHDRIREANRGTGIGPIIGPIVNITAGLTTPELLKLCDTLITPPCVKALYNITQGTLADPSNKLGIFEEGDFYAREDLLEFFALLAPEILPTTEPELNGVDGGHAPGLVATGESDLDFSLSYPIIFPQQTILYQTDDLFYSKGILTNSSGFLNTFLDAIDGSYCTFAAFGEKGDSAIDPKYPDPIILGFQGKLECGKYKPTNVISISYGEQEDDLPTNYQRRQCLEFLKLGLRGTSIILASGDSGVAARSTDDGNSDGCLGKNGTVFSPDFPASCPFVTALGATFLPKGGDVHKDEEISVTAFPSGGGFSNIYPTPNYQKSTLSSYFANHDPGYPFYSTKHRNNPPASVTKGGRYNRAGRGYPDASAIGDNVVIILDGVPMLIGGTSAAAPTFASILNRINEERIAAGKKTVGFVNPTMYKNPQMFHDITTGTNAGCNTTGFSSVSGWDPVSGLGTPNYPAMLKVFMALP